jgi:AcrR family transcriptional regulator
MAELSVKMIADRADLSPATVYNLFGSKGAVLAKVYERDLRVFERRVSELQPADALDRIFEAVGVVADLYRADPRFYRAAMSARDGGLDREMVLSAHRPRVAFWSRMVAQAVADGRLRADANPERLGVLMMQISTGALLHWVSDLISVDGLELETAFGIAAALHPFAVPSAQVRLQARLDQLDAALEREPSPRAMGRKPLS